MRKKETGKTEIKKRKKEKIKKKRGRDLLG